MMVVTGGERSVLTDLEVYDSLLLARLEVEAG